MAELRMRKVIKRYGPTTVIHGVDLDVDDGEFVVFVGPSGCGKSTLLRMISGLEDVSDGDLVIGGRRANDVSAAERGLAMVFQSYALYPHMTVYQNMAFGLENIGTPRAEIEAKVRGAAKLLQLDSLLERRPTLAVGRATAAVASDERSCASPRSSCSMSRCRTSTELRVQMRTEITALHRRLGTTMIYVTHDQVEAMTMADKIVVLRGGRIEQIGAPLDLYNAPANRFVAGFIGSPRMNFLPGRIVHAGATEVRVALGEAAGVEAVLALCGEGIAAGEEVSVGIRPEHVLLDVEHADVVFDAKVDQLEQLGAASLLYCSLPTGASLTVQTPGQIGHRAGGRCASQFRRPMPTSSGTRAASPHCHESVPRPGPRADPVESLGAASFSAGHEDGASFAFPSGWQCRLYILGDDLVRVLFTPPGGLREPRTWAIAAGGDDVPWQGRDRLDVSGFARPAFSIETSDGEVALTTSALRVVARLRPFGLAWARVDGTPSRSTARCSRINGAGRAAPSGTTWRARGAIATSGWATRPGHSTSTADAFARWHSTHWATTRERAIPCTSLGRT